MERSVQVLDSKYRLGRTLKQGEHSLIVAGTHIELREQVVVKILNADERDPRFAAKLRRQARQSAALRSEHVVRYLDVGHLRDGRPYVVMERLAGETLAERIATSGPLPVTQAVDAILQCCEALAWAHVRGILHRDLVTSNLFCTQQPDGRIMIKVLNFGTARAIDATGEQEDHGMTVAVLAFEAPDYKAPEQIVSRRDLDTRTDTWALGVILYELVTGIRPFAAPSVQETVRRILAAEVPPLPQIPPDLWSVIRGCLTMRREDRWDNVARVADALAHLAGPYTATYPARIREILRTPPPEETQIEDDVTEASPLVGPEHFALPPGLDGPNSIGSTDTDSGLPRLDDGHTSARSFPWLHVDALGGAVQPKPAPKAKAKMIAGVAVTLLATALAIVLVLKLVFDRPGDTRAHALVQAAAEESRPSPPLPRQEQDPAPAPLASAPSTPTADTRPVGTSAAPHDRAARVSRTAATAASGTASARPSQQRSPASRGTAESADPWGWER